jgi:hypothetical protein
VTTILFILGGTSKDERAAGMAGSGGLVVIVCPNQVQMRAVLSVVDGVVCSVRK